ncbi:MAG: penicillin-binding protein 2 [Myxococcota bacterium]
MTLKVRLSLVLMMLAMGLVIAMGKSAFLQLVRGPALTELSERQHTRSKKYSSFRGNILDRDGRLLATSVAVDSIYAEPRKMNHPHQVTKLLKQQISLDPEQIEKIPSDRSFVWLQRRIDPNVAARIKALGLEGIGLSEEEQRFYPNHGLLGQTLGFITLDGQTLGGIEQVFERFLKPKSWDTLSFQDARGTNVRDFVAPSQEALLGDNILLTIDRNIQSVAEEVLQRTVKAHNAKAGWAIVMKPKTGEILALANVPLMNPNRPSKRDIAARRNNAIARSGEPGSTFKMVTFAAGFDLGLIKPDEKIYCEKGKWDLGYMTIRDVSAKEWLTPTEIFKYSSNIGTFKIAERIGPKRLHEAVKRFGYGELPGLNLLEEARGSVSKYENWHKTRFANVSFGYGIMASPLQMAVMVSSIANGGVKVAPSILKGIQKGDGSLENPLPKAAPVRVISEQAAKAMTEMMIADTVDGTGKRAAIPGILVAGKTGTAEKVGVNGRYDKTMNISSFAGFAPADNPEIVCLVSIDEPKGIAYGGYVAAPAWREIVEAALLQTRGAL